MMIEPYNLSLREAQKAVGAGIISESGTPDAPPAQLIAEMLRETLCMFARPVNESGTWQPVYVTRLTNAVRRRLSPLWPQAGALDPEADGDAAPAQDEAWHDVTRKVLGCLEDVGDAIDCNDGYWLPSPVRFVKLPTGRVLVLSGFSTQVLCKILGTNIRQEGFARTILGTAPPSEDERWQDLATWQGAVPELREWTRAMVSKARMNLRPSAQDFTDFETYAPEPKRGRLQFYCWVRPDAISIVPRDLVLCRSVNGLPRGYWLGRLQIARDRTVLAAESRVSAEQVRRLQYGLDLEAGLSTRAEVVRGEHLAVLSLPNPLPPEERRVLLALAASSEGFLRPPIKCALSKESLPEVVAMLKNLGIQVTQSEFVGAG